MCSRRNKKTGQGRGKQGGHALYRLFHAGDRDLTMYVNEYPSDFVSGYGNTVVRESTVAYNAASKEVELTEEQAASVRACLTAVNSEFDGHYVSRDEACAFKERFYDDYVKIRGIQVDTTQSDYDLVQKYLRFWKDYEASIRLRNEAFIGYEMRRCEGLLSDIDGKSLDEQQRMVVVTDEDRTLVLAGAGSGKTLTIAGKVKYLCTEQHVDPADILLIAFTKKSAEEMTERIAGRLEIPMQAVTFHKLGLDILGAVSAKRPSVRDNLTEFVHSYFEEKILTDPETVRPILEFFAFYLDEPADMKKFSSLGEAYAFEKAADFETLKDKYARYQWLKNEDVEHGKDRRTLKNEQVKSLEEVSIANFLYLHGVEYEYERPYPFDTADVTHRAYKPDFYLPDYDIYLEHFGVNKEMRTPWLSGIEETKYLDGMRWKREVHLQNGTKLLETYSWLASEGRLLEYLDHLLQENGVVYNPPDFAEIFNTIYTTQGDKYYSEFIKLCCAFITLFKSQGMTIESLPGLRNVGSASTSQFHIKRTEQFKKIIGPLIQAYNEDLKRCGEVDFADMINLATKAVTEGYPIHRYKYVIIDEYQDISFARYKLIQAILNQTGAKLLCVGDDWQAIYRFAGSDISLFTGFESYFGKGLILRLENTYRNAQELIDVAGRFVMKNPGQFKKHLRSTKRLAYPIVFLCYAEEPYQRLKKAMNKIIEEFGPEQSVLLLGRNKADKDILTDSGLFEITEGQQYHYKLSPQTPVEFLTVHSAKGKEADNVILLNFKNATLGFPNKISDDPVLELVLTSPEDYKFAEERRLLYVALTRTRNRVYVLTDSEEPSAFYPEFDSSSSVFKLVGEEAEKERVNCPRCKDGYLVVRQNQSAGNSFLGCSNYPHCDYTLNDTSILSEPVRCPSCGGFLVIRKGKYDSNFYGCANYPYCEYTKPVV